MDTDDIAYPSRFERQMEYFISNNVDIVGSYATKISSDGIEKGLLKVPIDNNSIHQLIWTCPFIHPTVMFLKKSVLNAGGYSDKAGPRQDDYDLWFRCANMRYTFANIAEPLVYYRFFDDSVQKNSIKVGWARLKVGFKGAYKLRLPFIAYIGVSLPVIRSLLPFPLNVYFNSLMARVNPRNK